MNKYVWHGLPWTNTGCPKDGLMPKGWYDGFRLIIGEYLDPDTNKPYTQTKLAKIDCPECVVPEPVTQPKPVQNNNSLLWIVIGCVVIVVAAIAVVKFL